MGTDARPRCAALDRLPTDGSAFVRRWRGGGLRFLPRLNFSPADKAASQCGLVSLPGPTYKPTMNIVILPGLDGTGTLLAEVEELLAAVHDAAVLQYPSNLYRYEDLQTWVENHLPKKDFIIVAESFSGPIAAMVASKLPGNLRGVVFVATFAKTPRKIPPFLIRLVEIVPIKSRLVSALAQPFLMGRWSTRAFATKFRKALNLVPATTLAGRLREVVKVDVVGEIDHLNVPFIYLLAKNDRLIPSKVSLDFERTPNDVFQIEGPHFLLQANPSESAKLILKFATRIVPTDGVPSSPYPHLENRG